MVPEERYQRLAVSEERYCMRYHRLAVPNERHRMWYWKSGSFGTTETCGTGCGTACGTTGLLYRMSGTTDLRYRMRYSMRYHRLDVPKGLRLRSFGIATVWCCMRYTASLWYRMWQGCNQLRQASTRLQQNRLQVGYYQSQKVYNQIRQGSKQL